MSYRKYLVLFSLLFVTPAYSIVNIEKINIEDKRDPFQGELSFDVSGASGNSDIQATSVGSRMQWNNTSTKFIVLKYDYAKSSGIKSTDKTFMHFRYINNPLKPITWESFFQLQDDEFKLLKLRTLVGAGYRFKLSPKNEKSASRLGLGLFYSKEEQNDSLQTVDELVRFNLYYSYEYNVNKHTSFSSTTYYQPATDEFSDYRALEQLSFQFKIADDLLYFITLDVSYDNQPVNGLEKDDTSYKSGIQYRY